MSFLLKSFDNTKVEAAFRLFSPNLFRELAKKGYSARFVRLAKELELLEKIDYTMAVSDFFDAIFSILKQKNNRNEYAYKSAITQKILLGRHSLRTATILNEFRVCGNKADIVILNGTSAVYEIKSERDSLSRLSQQIESYRKVFANVNVITGENHISDVLAIVPNDVGVLLLTDRFQISTVRKATDSTDRIDPLEVFESIRLQEAKKILYKYGVDIPVVPNTQMNPILRKKFLALSPHEAHKGMVQILKKTRSMNYLSDYMIKIPFSLRSLALSTPLRKKDYSKLISVMDTPFDEALNWT